MVLRKMNIAVVHFSLNFLGGAEKLCLITMEGLRKAGHTVTLVTVEKTDWKAVQKNLGTVTLPNREIFLTSAKLSKRLRNLGIAATLFVIYVLEHILLKWSRKYDLVVSTFGDLFYSVADVAYVHFPLKASQTYSQVPPVSSEAVWRFQSKLYSLGVSIFNRIPPRLILVNSNFIKSIVRNSLGVQPIVVPPPVDVSYFIHSTKNQRDNTIVTVSGYSPKRHLEQIPIISSQTKNGKFLIIGKTDEYSTVTIQKLQTLIAQLNVESRVELLTNVPRPELRRQLAQAKIYLHTMPNEHFGTAIIEAMASGCVPIVHKSGGPWLDILEEKQGKCGYAYVNPKDASRYIELLLQDEDLRRKVATVAVRTSLSYDKSKFTKRIVALMETVYALNHEEKR